jgi:hypothetical protein
VIWARYWKPTRNWLRAGSGPESGPQGAQGRTQSMLRAAQARNSLAQPQLRAAYSPLRLQSRVLRSQSGNGIWRGQDSGVSIVALGFSCGGGEILGLLLKIALYQVQNNFSHATLSLCYILRGSLAPLFNPL